MTRKQLFILLVLVVIVVCAGLLLRRHSQATWESAGAQLGKKLLGDNFPVNDVATIAIQHGTNQLTLVKKDNLWRVRQRNDYPASFSQIGDLLMKVRDLKAVETEQVQPAQLPRLELAPGNASNSAMVVEFKDPGGKPLRTLLLGKKHTRKPDRPSPFGDMSDEGWPDGRWVKVGAESREAALISDPLSSVEPRPEQWLDKDFPKIEKARSITATFPAATNSWKLTRESETGEWKLADAKPGEQLDSSKVSGVTSPLTSLSFADVAAGAKPESLGLDKPTVVSVETFDHFNYTLKVGQKTNDNYPLTLAVAAQLPKERTPGKDEKPEDKTRLDKEFKDSQKKLEDKLNQEKSCEPWIYLVSTWTVEPLLKERSQLLAEKKEEPKKDQKPAAASAPLPSPPGMPSKPVAAVPAVPEAAPEPAPAPAPPAPPPSPK